MIGFGISGMATNGSGSAWLPEAIRFIGLIPRNRAPAVYPLFKASQLKNSETSGSDISAGWRSLWNRMK